MKVDLIFKFSLSIFCLFSDASGGLSTKQQFNLDPIASDGDSDPIAVELFDLLKSSSAQKFVNLLLLCACACMHVHVFLNFIHLFIYLSIYLFIYLFIYLSIYLFMYLFIYLFIY